MPYIGFTGDLEARIYQHKNEEFEGFTKHYHVRRLVYYEPFLDPSAGIKREKQVKKWNRAWKIHLIGKHNPDRQDLFLNEELLPLPIE